MMVKELKIEGQAEDQAKFSRWSVFCNTVFLSVSSLRNQDYLVPLTAEASKVAIPVVAWRWEKSNVDKVGYRIRKRHPRAV